MPKTILIVDDTASIRHVVASCLHAAGYEVAQAADGVEGLAAAGAQAFDLVLTDLNMPRMDGLALVAELRAQPDYRDVPILMLTTESSAGIKARGKAAGATGWLVKPFDPQRLVELVGRVLG